MEQVDKGKRELEIILTKMCNIIGVDYNSIDISKKDFFMAHSWSKETEREFKVWLFNYLTNNSKARDYLMFKNSADEQSIYNCVEAFVLSYGWKYTE